MKKFDTGDLVLWNNDIHKRQRKFFGFGIVVSEEHYNKCHILWSDGIVVHNETKYLLKTHEKHIIRQNVIRPL